MRALLAFAFLCQVHAEQCDADSNSMLQTKADKKEPTLVPVLERASVALTNAGPEDAQALTDTFAQDLQASMLQVADSEKEALLRRASQSASMSKLAEAYVGLPSEVKISVSEAAAASGEIARSYEQLSAEDQDTVLAQLNGGDLEQVVGGKTKTRRTDTRTHSHSHTRLANGGVITETTTRNKEGDVIHQHRHSNIKTGGGWATSTETRTKDSHSHSHSHAHGANGAATSTVTNGNSEHGHRHAHTHLGGATVSSTNGNFDHAHRPGHVHHSAPSRRRRRNRDD